jgi:hypothetical protein
VLSGESRFQGARRVQNRCAGVRPNGGAAYTTISTTIPAPDGQLIAEQAQITNAATYQLWFSVSSVTAGMDIVASVYMQGVGASIGKTVQLWLYENGTSVNAVVTLTSGWTRYSLSRANCTGGGDSRIGLISGAGTIATNDSVNMVYGQLEFVSGASNQAPGEYVSANLLAAPYHGAGVDKVKYFNTTNGNSVASNVVTEAAGTPIASATHLGYLAEESKTNLLLYSNDWTNAAWVKTTMTTALTSTGPDGITNSATRITASAGNALCLQTYVAAASTRTFSVWVKRITGTGAFELAQDGATFTAKTTTTAWTQVELSASQLNAVVGVRVVTNGDAFDVWCGQFEAGSIATSPIPTTTVAVTRQEDALTYLSAGNLVAAGSSESWYAEGLRFKLNTSKHAGLIFVLNSYRGLMFAASNNASRGYHDTAPTVVTGGGASVGTLSKVAFSFNGTTLTVAGSGAVSAATAMGAQPTMVSSFNVGRQNTGEAFVAGIVRNVRLYNVAFTDATLVAITS